MNQHDPIELTFFHDVLCPWSYVAAARIRALQQALGDELRVTLRPYPLRREEERPTKDELGEILRDIRRAAREPEGKGISLELWRGDDPPLSSMPPLLAVESAAIQGLEARDALLDAMRDAAFRHGVNVSRTDVIFELAGGLGLDMRRFAAGFQSRSTREAVEESFREANAHGVKALPAVAVGETYSMTGLRPLAEYLDLVRRWREERFAGPLRIVH